MEFKSLSSNSSYFAPLLLSNSSYNLSVLLCLTSRPSTLIFTAYTVTTILLLLPLCILILYLGFQQWWKQRSAPTAVNGKQSEVFTYNIIATELINIVGATVICFGWHTHHLKMAQVGDILLSFSWHGHLLFHVLTCVERYLAVVHPITYLGVKKTSTIRIRNVIIGCVWLFSFSGTGSLFAKMILMIVDFCLLSFCLMIMCFCSVSILCVLIRPGPGEAGRDKARLNQSKQRAFYAILAIMGTLLLKFLWHVIWIVCSLFSLLSADEFCVISACELWFTLPNSLVIPLLFLHKRGKLHCCKNN